MALTSTGLTNGGRTTHYQFQYDDSLSAPLNPSGPEPARTNLVIAACDDDYSLMSGWFGKIDLGFTTPIPVNVTQAAKDGTEIAEKPGFTTLIPVNVTQESGGASWLWDGSGLTVTIKPGKGAESFIRYLLVMEVVEVFMDKQRKGWFESGDEGSKGEALSRFLGYQFLALKDLDRSIPIDSDGGWSFLVANIWLNSTRQDFVNTDKDDNHPDATTGCTTLFLYYLSTQLQFAIPEIIKAGAPNLSGVYKTLTGDGDSVDPFLLFKRLLDNAFPDTNTIKSGPNFDNPFPLGLLSFSVDQNSSVDQYRFDRDQAQNIINNQGGLVSNAFELVLEGFSINSYNALNISIPAPTGAFVGLAGITVTPTPATPGDPPPSAPIATFDVPTNLKAPQRIRFSFDIKFSKLDAFPDAVGADAVKAKLEAKATVGGATGSNLPGTSASMPFELRGPYPEAVSLA